MIRKLLGACSKFPFIEAALFLVAKFVGKLSTKRRKPRVQTAQREIDAVYLWVNDQDQNWITKRGNFRPEAEAKVATSKSRFRQFDELPYSIQLLAKNASFINRVFVVVDDQVPHLSHLADTLPFDVVLINHREFIPSKYLPTFNSRAITAHLHLIPGLSERFLYCNDDVFIGAPSEIHDWFVGENPVLRFTKTKFPDLVSLPENEVLYRARWKTKALATEKGWNVPAKMPEHAPYPLSKTQLLKLWKLFPSELETTAEAKFRTSDAILPELLAFYLAIGDGTARKPKTSTYKYVPMNEKTGVLPLIDLALKPNHYLSICLNDVSDAEESNLISDSALSLRYQRTLNYLLSTTT